MKRALYIVHKEIYPVRGGDQVRFSQQLNMLRTAGYDTDVLALTHSAEAAADNILYVPRLRRYIRAARTLINHLPEVVNHYRDPRIAEFVAERSADYDVVLCGSPAMAQYCPDGHPGARLDMTDSLAMNYLNASRRAAPGYRQWLHSQSSRMSAWEETCRRRFGRVAYISEVDRAFVPTLMDKTVIVSNYVDRPKPEEYCRHSAPVRTITFLGRMDYEPNILAVKHFAELWQKGLSRHADRFDIVGGYPTASVRALGDIPGIHVHGFVPSLADFWRDSALFVAPMLSGSGIQNKILQAMAHGCCVVTTPIGAEGLDADSGGIAVSAPGAEFADTVAALLGDPRRRAAIGARAREYVAENFSPEAVQEQFETFIH